MDAEFWLQRWREGRTNFHQARVTPPLEKFWRLLELPPGSRVLVPLAGKTLDMLWLARQGLRVLGVELSPLAVEQFFAENGLQPVVRDSAQGRHYTAGDIELICGDIFDLDDATLAGCTGVYDRAALVALPADMRARYVDRVYGRLPGGYRGLLVSLDYPQDQMAGPPFSVDDDEVRRLYADHTEVELVSRHDSLAKEPKFLQAGVTRLDTLVYQLRGRG